MTDYVQFIAANLKVPAKQVESTIELLDAGNTIPFVARYRKEATGGLDEEVLRNIRDLLEKQRALDERRTTVLKTIEELGVLTPELKKEILAAKTRTELEDIYQPYKPKRRTRATVAREKGLGGLADLILSQKTTNKPLEDFLQLFLNENVQNYDEALEGARDIVAEIVSDHPEVRKTTRNGAFHHGMCKSSKIETAGDPKGVYQDYYEFEFRVGALRPHQVLAINRGEAEKILRVKIDVPDRDWRGAVEHEFRPNKNSPFYGLLVEAIEDGANRLLLPAIERDVRRKLTELSETHAIKVFADNLRALINQPPLSGYILLGIDPGFRTGCKIAVVDETGKLLDTGTIYPYSSEERRQEAIETLHATILRHGVDLIAIGNGTASRETEQLIADLIPGIKGVKYLMVNEAGASVYSASKLARMELPELDVSLRGAVSIARRVQDPLAELVKIDPKSIGVGMYQHDVNQKQLSETLDGVVESVVNQVGVDVNTASPALLTYVAGIGPKLAEQIVNHRDTNGPFRTRESIKSVPGVGPKAYEQAGGFLRVRNGDQPLDTSAIHPESYPIAQRILDLAGLNLDSPLEARKPVLEKLMRDYPLEELANDLESGVPTLKDIFEQLIRPGRDPRDDLPAPILRSDVLSMDDLRVGMGLKGTVRNVVDFGAFVDIGVKQDGLLHRSQIPKGTVLRVGDIIDVKIVKIDADRGRVGLSLPGV